MLYLPLKTQQCWMRGDELEDCYYTLSSGGGLHEVTLVAAVEGTGRF